MGRRQPKSDCLARVVLRKPRVESEGRYAVAHHEARMQYEAIVVDIPNEDKNQAEAEMVEDTPTRSIMEKMAGIAEDQRDDEGLQFRAPRPELAHVHAIEAQHAQHRDLKRQQNDFAFAGLAFRSVLARVWGRIGCFVLRAPSDRRLVVFGDRNISADRQHWRERGVAEAPSGQRLTLGVGDKGIAGQRGVLSARRFGGVFVAAFGMSTGETRRRLGQRGCTLRIAAGVGCGAGHLQLSIAPRRWMQPPRLL
mmetsp:Transcript_73694/g.204979  ORF Transcript_73694/g.204979 Transcript_73694/m.204979 type:complete len:252 (+) Transcript_73694:437-1192(+)